MTTSARKLPVPARSSPAQCVIVGGVTYPLHREPGGNWRIRKRSKVHRIDVGLGISSLPEAKAKARQIIETDTANLSRLRSGGASLRELCDAYLDMPKETRDYVARQNVTYFAAVVRTVLKKTLMEARTSEVTSRLWQEFARIRQGGRLDYALPQKGNAGINGAVRSSLCIFARGLETEYERRGYRLDWSELRRVKWLKELKTLKQGEPAELPTAIRALRTTDPCLWRAAGLARFAGLRQHELQHAQRHWLERDDHGNTHVIVMHRPEEGSGRSPMSRDARSSWMRR